MTYLYHVLPKHFYLHFHAQCYIFWKSQYLQYNCLSLGAFHMQLEWELRGGGSGKSTAIYLSSLTAQGIPLTHTLSHTQT
jgi:hypothetical protein